MNEQSNRNKKMSYNVWKRSFGHVRQREDCDQTAYSRSLIRIFTGRNFDSQDSGVTRTELFLRTTRKVLKK